MDEKIIEVQGIKLTKKAIEALLELQKSSVNDSFISDIDRISRFLLNESLSMDNDMHTDILFCLQILSLMRDCFLDLGIGENFQDD